MAKWNSLPREIVLKVAEYLKHDTFKRQWMYTNKELYEAFATFEYNSQFFDFLIITKTMDAVLNSPLTPGKWLKTLYIHTFNIPHDLNKVNRTTDVLFRLMKRTPNVKSVCFRGVGTKEWLYFTTALSDKNTKWQLESLMAPNDYRCFPYYYNCAYLMRNSLKDLHLGNGMMIGTDYEQLVKFQQLKRLFIGKNMLEDVFDLNSILKYLPQLVELYVDGFQFNGSLDDDEGGNNNIMSIRTATAKYNNIQHLEIKNFIDWGEKELVYLINTFTELQHLTLCGQIASSLENRKSGTLLLNLFMDFILKIEYAFVDLGGISFDQDTFKDMYPLHRENALTKQSDSCGLCLSMNFVNKGSSFVHGENGTSLEQRFIHQNQPLRSTIGFIYDINNSNPVDLNLAVLNKLNHVEYNVQKVQLNWIKCRINKQIGEYIRTLVRSNHQNIKELKVTSGAFGMYAVDGGGGEPTAVESNIQAQQQHNITQLKFSKTKIYDDALSHLSRDFVYLERLTFDSCNFGDFSSDIGICMENTTVGTINIRNDGSKYRYNGSLILVSLDLQDQNISRYYMNVTSESGNYTGPNYYTSSDDDDSDTGDDNDSDTSEDQGNNNNNNQGDGGSLRQKGNCYYADNMSDDDDKAIIIEKDKQEVTEISKMTYDQLKRTIANQNVTILSFRLKSLARLDIILKIRGINRQIDLSFPPAPPLPPSP